MQEALYGRWSGVMFLVMDGGMEPSCVIFRSSGIHLLIRSL